MKNKTLRNDLIILGILVVLIGGLFLFKSKQQGAKIVIKRNDQIEGYYSLILIMKIKYKLKIMRFL